MSLDKTLILTDLTEFDFQFFHAARCLYSGSTGYVLGDFNYPHTSYIATYMSEFAKAVYAMRWAQVDVTITPHVVYARARREPLAKLKKAARRRRKTGPRRIRLRS